MRTDSRVAGDDREESEDEVEERDEEEEDDDEYPGSRVDGAVGAEKWLGLKRRKYPPIVRLYSASSSDSSWRPVDDGSMVSCDWWPSVSEVDCDIDSRLLGVVSGSPIESGMPGSRFKLLWSPNSLAASSMYP